MIRWSGNESWYDPSHTPVMKTAVSIPDPVFAAAEDLAEKLGVSRSELYSRALASFLGERFDRSVTDRLNEVYADADTALDLALGRLQAASLDRDEW